MTHLSSVQRRLGEDIVCDSEAPFKPISLPYSYNALSPHIDAATMKEHYDKHYKTYIRNLNKAIKGYKPLQSLEIDQILSDLSKVPEKIRDDVRNNGGGYYNHSLFWLMMEPNRTLTLPSGKLRNDIIRDFGSYRDFKNEFTKLAKAHFGSGWIWLVKNGRKLEIMNTPNQDTPIMDGKMPLLGLDIWEHAYYIKYKSDKMSYVRAWWNVVNWEWIAAKYMMAI